MKKLRLLSNKVRLTLAAAGCLALIFLPARTILAADVIGTGCEGVPNATLCQNNTGQPKGSNDIYGPSGILTKLTRLVAVIVGAASVIVIIIGGIRYVMSSGDPSNVNGAKNAILFAVVGLVVALFAQAIVLFVLNKLP